MKDKIIKIISRVTEIDVKDLEKDCDKTLWDSFSHIDIILSIEDEFNAMFTQEEITQAKTIDKIMQLLEGKLQK